MCSGNCSLLISIAMSLLSQCKAGQSDGEKHLPALRQVVYLSLQPKPQKTRQVYPSPLAQPKRKGNKSSLDCLTHQDGSHWLAPRWVQYTQHSALVRTLVQSALCLGSTNLCTTVSGQVTTFDHACASYASLNGPQMLAILPRLYAIKINISTPLLVVVDWVYNNHIPCILECIQNTNHIADKCYLNKQVLCCL